MLMEDTDRLAPRGPDVLLESVIGWLLDGH
jgi:hypothetical protein